MDYAEIDWNEMWRHDFLASTASSLAVEYWASRAEGFNEWLRFDAYTQQILNRLNLNANYSVLDVGCGPGNLTIPLAQKVRNVTALDYAPKMILCVEENARKAGLTNINTVRADWHEVIIGQDIAVHDVVVSSGSLITTNLKQFLKKLDDASRVAVFITWEVVHPFNDGTYRAIGRKQTNYPSYVIIYNLLYSMGIFASIEIFESTQQIRYQSLEQAIAYWHWKTGGLTAEEEQKLRAHFSTILEEEDGEWRPKDKKASKWALFSWHK